MTRYIILALLVTTAVAAPVVYFKNQDDKPAAASAAQALTVSKGDIETLITAQGKLEPKDYVDVGAQVSGQIMKLHAETGDNVSEGDLIAEIDPQTYETRIAGAQAQLKTLSAQASQQAAQIKQAKQKLDRAKTLIATNAISKESHDDAKTAYDIAIAQGKSLEAQIEQAKSTLDGYNVDLGYTRIFAPMAGTVVSQSIKAGQTINASQTAPVIVQIANLDTMTVRAQVAEADIARLHPDMDVYFTTLGSGTRRWNGTIRQILPSPETINDVVLYNVLVDVDNTDRKLMTGMTTQMFFIEGSAKEAPMIPLSALGARMPNDDKDGAQAYAATKLVNGKPTPVTLLIGLQNRTAAQVISGANIGDQFLPAMNAAASSSGAPRGMRNMGPRL